MKSPVEHVHIRKANEAMPCKWCGQLTMILYDCRNVLTARLDFMRFARPFCDLKCRDSYFN